MTDPAKTGPTWPTLFAGAVMAMLIAAGLVAFIVVPISQADRLGLSPWAAICRAAGFTHAPLAAVNAPAGPTPASTVVVDTALLASLAHADLADGAQTAGATCAACHGPAGVPTDPQYPVLADQSAVAIYKALRDFKSGARVSPFMAPMVQSLSDKQMVNVAAYFAHDRAFGGLGPRWEMPDAYAASVVTRGDGARGLPACDACHAPDAGGPIESPVLYGQSQVYLQAQLQAFASGARRDDEYGRMRAVAGKLSPAEQAELALYYQGLGPDKR